MRTQTIHNALEQAKHAIGIAIWEEQLTPRKFRQAAAFHAELLRRLDERDTLRAELAEARAFISTIIDGPKDYPAEEGM